MNISKGYGRTRENNLMVKLTDQERKTIERAAEKEGLPTSTFVRVKMLEICKEGQ